MAIIASSQTGTFFVKGLNISRPTQQLPLTYRILTVMSINRTNSDITIYTNNAWLTYPKI